MDIRPLGNLPTRSISTDGSPKDSAVVSGAENEAGATAPDSGVGSVPSTDRVEISAAAREAARIRDIVANEPDVRQDKVSAIQQRLADGTYQVSPELLAKRLLGES
ncbi:MAG: Anti-sigma-28 factor, FlgM [Chloroflexota bacterium]|jgi:flagellar biosynthesis anti-sigma factor FlgM|nr:Anti-sigma-28 factor, FlgM [Chloroflexota bacterium]